MRRIKAIPIYWTPTIYEVIEAIPIDWIEQWAEKHERTNAYGIIDVRNMINEWRQENEFNSLNDDTQHHTRNSDDKGEKMSKIIKAECTNEDVLTPTQSTYSGKAILILNEMPKSCDNCPCYHEGYGHCNSVKFRFIQDSDKVAPWCPLKPMPQSMPYEQTDTQTVKAVKVDNGFRAGWNKCIEEIEK